MTASVWTPAGNGITLSNLNRISEEFTATAGQTLFTLSITPYTVGAENLEVYRNGSKLLPSVVTEISGGTSFSVPASTVGDKIESVVFPGTSNSFVTLANQAQAGANSAAASAIAAASSAALAATFSTGWQTANNNWTGTNNFVQNVTVQGTVSMGSAFGFRNLLINADFSIDQRKQGASFTFVNDYGGPDRWVYVSSGVAVTGIRAFDFISNAALTITGVAGNTSASVLQRIEDVNSRRLATTTIFTVCAYIYNATGSPLTPTIYCACPTAANNYTSTVALSCTPFQTIPNGTSTLVTSQVTVNTACQYGLQVNIGFGALTAGKVVEISKVQVEAGTVATPFENRPVGLELALCQRYCRPIGAVYSMVGQACLATTAILNSFGVPMRAIPTLSTTAGFSVTNAAAGNIAVTGISCGASSSDGVLVININTAGGLVAGNACLLSVAPANAVLTSEL